MLTEQSRKALRSLRRQAVIGDVLWGFMTLCLCALLPMALTPNAVLVISLGILACVTLGIMTHYAQADSYADYERRCIAYSAGYRTGEADALRCAAPRCPACSIDYRMGYADGYEQGLKDRPANIIDFVQARSK